MVKSSLDWPIVPVKLLLLGKKKILEIALFLMRNSFQQVDLEFHIMIFNLVWLSSSVRIFSVRKTYHYKILACSFPS